MGTTLLGIESWGWGGSMRIIVSPRDSGKGGVRGSAGLGESGLLSWVDGGGSAGVE